MRVRTLRHHSTLLRGNHFGDPADREVVVVEPTGWTGEPLPALLGIAGFTGNHYGFLNRKWREENLVQRFERLMSEGSPPALLVLPDTMTRYGGSQFLDTPSFGPYASWITTELLPWVGEQYPVQGWGVFGKSSGGYGALSLAMNHPGVFGAIAAHAPDAGFEYGYTPDFPKAVEALRAAGGLTAWLADFHGRRGLKGPDHGILNLLAMSLCYSPDMTASPLPCRLPVDLETGELVREVFDTWLPRDPARRVATHHAHLSNTAIWLDVGTRDEFRLQVGARMVHRAMNEHGVQHHYEEHGGGHFRLNDRLDFSLPFLASALRPATGA